MTCLRLSLLLTLLFAASCNNVAVSGAAGKLVGKNEASGPEADADGGEAPESPDAGDEAGTDPPGWVNGSFLGCEWHGADEERAGHVHVLCGINDRDGLAVPPDPSVRVAWQVAAEDGSIVAVEQKPSGSEERIEVVFVMAQRDVGHRAVTYAVGGRAPSGASVAKVVLAESLPGLAPEDELRKCLESEDKEAAACLKAAGSAPSANPEAEQVKAGGGSGVKTARMFVTQSAYNGAGIGGIEGANLKCMSAAQQVVGSRKVTGNWIALLGRTAVERLQANRINRFVDLKGRELASSVEALGGPLETPLNLSERLQVVSGKAYTGLRDLATAGGDCGGWRSILPNVTGTVGTVGATTRDWLGSSANSPCLLTAHLYCVELP